MIDFTPIHIPVLQKEIISFFKKIGNSNPLHFMDCTAGEGGHSELILENFPDSKLVLVDRDETLLERAEARVNRFESRVFPINANFSEINKNTIPDEFMDGFDGILLDFGISTFHIKNSGRGFSFQTDEPLDMRLDNDQFLDAKKIVNEYSPEKLLDIFRKYGEENWSLKIVDFIIAERRKKKFVTTKDLAKIVEKAIPRKFWPEKVHPSFRIFQAIRIEVNGELKHIEKAMDTLPFLLKKKWNSMCDIFSFS